MNTITLISTYHSESGLANCNELYQILDKIKPNIIFEEIPQSFFDLYYKDKTKSNLESQTINMYLIEHDIKHIPVDYYNVPKDFFENTGKVHEYVERRSRTYRYLVDRNKYLLTQYGFPYLNSIDSEICNSKLSTEIKETLHESKKSELIEIWNTWEKIEEERESEMIKNIYDYSYRNEYNQGVFLLGAGHRVSIKEKIKNKIKQKDLIHWNFELITA